MPVSPLVARSRMGSRSPSVANHTPWAATCGSAGIAAAAVSATACASALLPCSVSEGR